MPGWTGCEPGISPSLPLTRPPLPGTLLTSIITTATADMALDARQWLQRIWDLSLEGRVRIMNVCGGHERSITMAGLRAALPPNLELIPGPGCPVCICPEEDVYRAIQLARQQDLIPRVARNTGSYQTRGQ